MNIDFSTILKRALTAGAAVGVIMAGYMYFVVEPTVDEAIALEEALAAAEPADPGEHGEEEEPLFTRGQQTAGGVAANFVYSVIASAVFGIVFAKIRHRLPGTTDLARSAWLAAVAFGTVALMPAIKYPANPPAVGDPDTVNERTIQYLAVIVVSVVAAIALTRLAGVLRHRLDRATQILAVTALTVVTYGLILAVLPGTPDAIADEVPAALVWDFRLRSIGGLALLWTGLGVGFGWLLGRPAMARAESVAEVAGLARS